MRCENTAYIREGILESLKSSNEVSAVCLCLQCSANHSTFKETKNRLNLSSASEHMVGKQLVSNKTNGSFQLHGAVWHGWPSLEPFLFWFSI